jgi:DNA adenine methylase
MRYCGGKQKAWILARIITHHVPAGGMYWEPFVGAGGVMQRVNNCRRYGSDLDRHIINLLTAVQDGWQPPRRLDQEEHRYWRSVRDNSNSPMVAFAGYGCSFGGDFLGGYARDAIGGNYAEKARTTLLHQRPFLRGVNLRQRDYREGFWLPEPPDVIYCDPPYAGTSAVGTPSAGGRARPFDSAEFWRWATRQTEASIVLVSEYTCPLLGVRQVWQRDLPTSLRMTGADRRTERLFCLNPEVRIGLGV